uniref:Uncharacterized protein n=1 Tax=Myoviridae sp. ctv1i11 TaxID=2826709 RepID=A0A8S5MUJ8_9CAUD|nr:MAG TPA: hypothetical protein [Myoviridae sp. ctv1i11]
MRTTNNRVVLFVSFNEKRNTLNIFKIIFKIFEIKRYFLDGKSPVVASARCLSVREKFFQVESTLPIDTYGRRSKNGH